MAPAVHQLLPVLSRGDAIGSAVVRFQDLLRRLGHRSEIFADLVDRRLGVHAHPAEQLQKLLAPGDAVMYHLSTGSPLAGVFERLDARRLVYYHNITPAECMDGVSAVQAHRLRWGRADLEALAPVAELGIAASRYSAGELSAAGARRVAVVPLPVDLARLRPRPATAPPAVTLLFVGRFAPHKRQDELIRVVTALRGTHAPQARLVLAGAAAVDGYTDSLREYAARLGAGDAVTVAAGLTPDHPLGDLYAGASVFVCASEHEGFCVPLLEAMAFSLPILAHDSGAVAETVGDAGIVTAGRDPLVWAEIAWRLATDQRLRAQLSAASAVRLHELGDAAVERALAEALARIS